MNLWRLTFAYLRARWTTALLNLLLMGLGLGTVVFLLLAGHQMERKLTQDARGIHLVMGARGSRLQLVLAALYHADIPAGNISLQIMEIMKAHPMIEEPIPLALGDSFESFRIVGTTHAYPRHYEAALHRGRLWASPMEVVLGAEVASRTGLDLGDTLTGSHGLAAGGTTHDAHAYRVTGIFRATGTILDRLVLTALESIWQSHEPAEATATSGGNVPSKREITAVLATYRSPVAAATTPFELERETGLTAASPAREMARLLSLVGVGLDAFRGFGFLLTGLAGLGIFIMLFNAMRERRGDMAIMRALGASRRLLFGQVMLEGVLLTMSGYLLGWGLGHGAAHIAPLFSDQARHLGLHGGFLLTSELMLLLLALGVGLAASFLPAWSAYRTPIAQTLAQS